jgi:hypothetical protein
MHHASAEGRKRKIKFVSEQNILYCNQDVAGATLQSLRRVDKNGTILKLEM